MKPFILDAMLVVSADFGIQHCDKLESASLMRLCRPNGNETDDAAGNDSAWVLGTLSQLTSTRVRTVTLGFSSYSVNDLSTLDLKRVKDHLLQPHLANSTAILIVPES